jgi:hypothetical protein
VEGCFDNVYLWDLSPALVSICYCSWAASLASCIAAVTIAMNHKALLLLLLLPSHLLFIQQLLLPRLPRTLNICTCGTTCSSARRRVCYYSTNSITTKLAPPLLLHRPQGVCSRQQLHQSHCHHLRLRQVKVQGRVPLHHQNLLYQAQPHLGCFT